VFQKVMHNRILAGGKTIIEIDGLLVDFHGGGEHWKLLSLERKIKVLFQYWIFTLTSSKY